MQQLLKGIHPTIDYKRLKDFMEASKERMRGTRSVRRPACRLFKP